MPLADVKDAEVPQRGSVSAVSRLAIASIVIALCVVGIKYLAYHLTGSVALYSDALESVVNVVTAIAALVAIRVAIRPADRRHQFGHHKAEYFSAVAEGVLITGAAVLILLAAWKGVSNPRAIEQPALGLAVSAVAMLVNAVWAWMLISRGRQWHSPALAADGWHLVSDVVTSAGVMVGLLLAIVTGWHILDPLLAAIVALSILYAGGRLMRASASGLMDEAVGADIAGRIREAIKESGDGAIEAHDLRTRAAGRATFIEFHLVVPGAMSVAKAHDICDRLEAAIVAVVPGAEVIVHVEPEGEAGHGGIRLG